jgi:hypothetical protein
MKKHTFLFILILITSATSLLHAMKRKEKNPHISYTQMTHKENLYITDDSLNNFDERKMLSTGSLDALTRLKEQEVIISLDDLENQGYKIIKPNSRCRRWGGALRRYATTFCVAGTAAMISFLFYYLYSAKGDIKKVNGIVDDAEETITLIKNIIPDAQIALKLAKDFFNCSVPSYKFIEDLIEARNKLCKSCP